MERPKRKTIRLQAYDYNTPGYYFITFCTKEKQKLCDIVGTGLPDGPRIHYSAYGEEAVKRLEFMSDFYSDIRLEKYVVMPNHIHLLLHILDCGGGPSGRPVPTNSCISRFVGTFKRFCNRAYGQNIWQARSHDHVVRGEQDYLRIWEYIDTHPVRREDDCFYVE